MAKKPETKKINGNISNNKEGTFKKVKIIGYKRCSSFKTFFDKKEFIN